MKIITSLNPNEVFVFGSNTQGRHGKGAALQAMKFGAIYGQARGMQGFCYAICTKELRKGFTQPTIGHIEKEIKVLFEVAKENPTKIYLLTPIGTGLGSLSYNQLNKITANAPVNIVKLWKK